MSRPSPQEQAEIDAASERMTECERCALGGRDSSGALACREPGTERRETPKTPGAACRWFEPCGAPASSPVSTDREGPDLLEAASALLHEVEENVVGSCPGWPEPVGEVTRKNLARAISSEEARRERPAVAVPRMTDDEFEHLTPVEVIREARRARASEETLQVALARAAGPGVLMVDERKAAALLGDLDHYTGPVLAVEDPRDATIAKLRDALLDVQWSKEIRGYGSACPWCDCGAHDGGHDPNCQLAAALRSAGVEPTPASSDPAFDGMPCAICGEPLPHEKCGPTPEAQEGRAGR